ncbi:MAG TPA: carboxypeptidase-like regulatory domain-containing protein, partial [Balneolales bacterium]|nr:carboxypeptidase-like regulatory domain-containing protein [Balneolales bacterium]
MKKVLLNTLLVSCLLFVGMISQAKAQQRSIKGKVTDASNGDPLPGANVYIPKLNIGAATGVNGTYVISSVPTGTYTVTVTYVGYKKYTTTVEVADHNVTLNVKLQASNVGLNQVFVTAQGEKKTKNELSYSAQQVQPQSIQSVHAQNFTNLLSGKVSGLDVRPSNTMGGSTNMVLRGITSLTGNNQPLFVIDGVPFANSNTNTGAEQAGF